MFSGVRNTEKTNKQTKNTSAVSTANATATQRNVLPPKNC